MGRTRPFVVHLYDVIALVISFLGIFAVLCLLADESQVSVAVTGDHIFKAIDVVREHGGFVLPYMVPNFSPESGWGYVFNDSAPPKDPAYTNRVFVRVPRHLLLCNTTDETNLIEVVLTAYKTNMTFWRFYFDSIPRKVELLWDWSASELELLNNNHIINEVKQALAKYHKLYEKLQTKLPFKFSHEDFKLVAAWVISRAFNVKQWHCLVPAADLPNHHPDAPTTSWQWYTDPRTGEVSYRMVGETLARKGSEFLISYQTVLTNEEALKDYGFADPNSVHQQMDFRYPEDVADKEAKVAIIYALVLTYNVDAPYVLNFFRVFVATKEELDSMHDPPVHTWMGAFVQPLTLRRELDAAEACIREIQAFRPRKKLLSIEFQYAHDKTLHHRHKFALAYNIAYDRMFERTSQFCSRYREFVQCIPLWRLRIVHVGIR